MRGTCLLFAGLSILVACGGDEDVTASNDGDATVSAGGNGGSAGGAGVAGNAGAAGVGGKAGGAGAAGVAGAGGVGASGQAGAAGKAGAGGGTAGFPSSGGAAGTSGAAGSGGASGAAAGTGGAAGGKAGASGTAGAGMGGAAAGASGTAGAGCGPAGDGMPGAGACTFPQGVPDPGFIANACSFQDTDPTVDAAVNAAMVKLSGCGAGSDCPIVGFPGTNADEVCQSWFAAVTDELRKQGYCAGQHAVGSTDEIAVSKTGCTGKWYGYHVCFYGGPKVVWSPGARRGWWQIAPSYCP